ncbi:ABC transporter substrate-binding protein [Bifidobacterium canis]|uniref:ABC transporter substrate-binding protein n=1 Tax=Bifidobacterium canis TaxID=2610880 RepID=A0A7K1J7Q0_9BIFI|nr:ABC transporter substrate-binding protein [Bifidobacterium canis]MUH60460.1 ABC transporter substrate-binding protein [Bifidobacterium canis]
MTQQNNGSPTPQNEHSSASENTPNTSASTDSSLQAHAKSEKPRSPWRTWVIAIIAVIIVAAAVFAIVNHTRASRSAQQSAGEQADTVTIGLKLAPTNLDIRNTAGTALDQALIGNVYEGLVSRNSENKVTPGLAKSWDVSKDGLTYTFHLNKNMHFSNGDELNAQDVVWSIEQLEEKKYHDYDTLRNFKSVTAPDDDTVVITLSKPYSQLLWSLSGRAGLVFDKDAKYVAKTQAVGSGPYKLAKFTPNNSIELVADENYWGANKAKTKNVTLRYFADDDAAVNALKSGDVQVLAPVNATLAKSLGDDYTVKAGDGTDKYVLAMNNASGKATADKRVRQAIRYAIDHEQLIASRGGADKALGGPIPSLDPGYEDLTNLYPHDLAKAKKLLSEAGYSASNPLKLTLTYPNTYGTELGDQLRSQLKEANIDLKVNVVEFSTWLQDVYTDKDYDLSMVDHNESHDFSQWTNPDYYYGYDNKEVQDLASKALSSTDETQADEDLKAAAKIVSEDAAADWLFNYRVTSATAKGVEGFPFNMNQTVMPLAQLTYTPAK